MGEEKVIVTMGAKDAGMAAAWQRAMEGPEAFARELEAIVAKSKAAQRASNDLASDAGTAFKSLADKLVGIGASVAGVVTVSATLRNEYDQLIARQKAAADFQVSLAGAQRAAVRNFGEAGMSGADLRNTINSIGQSTNAPLQALYQAASGVLSARGNISPQEALTQLQSVAGLDPSFSAEEMRSLAGAALDVRKAFGGTADQAVGALMASQQTARIENTGQFAANAVPALVGLRQFGGTFRESSALIAALSQASGDFTGAQSGTAAITLAKQVEEAINVTAAGGLTKSEQARREKLASELTEARGRSEELGRDWQRMQRENTAELAQRNLEDQEIALRRAGRKPVTGDDAIDKIDDEQRALRRAEDDASRNERAAEVQRKNAQVAADIQRITAEQQALAATEAARQQTAIEAAPRIAAARGGTLADKFNFLMNDPAMKDQLATLLGWGEGALTGEAKQLMGMRGMLTPGSQAMQLFANAFQATPDMNRADAALGVYRKQIAAFPEQGVAALAESTRAAAEKLMSDPQLGTHGGVRAAVETGLEKAGMSGIGRWWRMMEFDVQTNLNGVDPKEFGAEILRGEGRDYGGEIGATLSRLADVIEGRTVQEVRIVDDERANAQRRSAPVNRPVEQVGR